MLCDQLSLSTAIFKNTLMHTVSWTVVLHTLN